MNIALYTSISVLATAISVGSAYTASGGDSLEMMKFLFKSRVHILILVNMTYNVLFLFGKLVQRTFFGNLRDVETQNLSDRLLTYVLFKIVFVGAVMEPDVKNLLIWTSWFSILGFLKIFTLLARDRFEYLNTFSPHTTPTIHVRMLSLLVLILFSDLAWFFICVRLFFDAGISVLLLLNFECFTIFLDTVQTLLKYAIHLLDLARVHGVWEQRGQYIYYIEFATDSLVLAGTLGHYMHILYLHGLSVTLLDAVLFMHMRIVFNNLRDKIVAYRNYRQLAENMNHRYPTVSDDDLQSYNDDCAICRERMRSGKKLPCGHIFHHSCLRCWLEQHHSCPTCRYSLIEQSHPQSQPHPQQQAPHPPPHTPSYPPPHPQPQPHPHPHPQLPPAHFPPFTPHHGLPAVPHGMGQPPHPNPALLRFSGDRWFGWLPSFSVEVVRRQGQVPSPGWGIAVPPEMIRAVQEIFPEMPPHIIAQDLAITHSVERTTENILEGRVVPPVNNMHYPPPLQTHPILPSNTTLSPSLTSPASLTSNIPMSSTINNTNSSTPTLNNNSVNNNTSQQNESTSSGSNLPGVLSKYSDTFASNPQERKQSLTARKQAMLEAARRHYLDMSSKPQSAAQSILQPSSTILSSPSLPLQSPQIQAHYPQPAHQPSQQELSQNSEKEDTPAPPLQSREDQLEQRRRLLLEAAQRRAASMNTPPGSPT